MSLKSELNQIIKDRNGGVVTLKEIEDYCHKASYKLSNAERRLRPSESPNIAPVWNKKHTAIIGYKYLTIGVLVGELVDKKVKENMRKDLPHNLSWLNEPKYQRPKQETIKQGLF